MGKSDNYRIEDKEPIGEGSFGKVFRGWKLDTKQLVALKVIRKVAHNEKELQVLRSESEIHSKLNHRNIIKMLDYYDSDKELVLITECARCSLAELINPGESPNPSQVQRIACDITSALFYLHSDRILHRDLKPQNVLLGFDGLAKLCDFGFAKNVATDTFLLTSYKGTPLYMAPEIIDFKPYDCKADLWSVGCILYELIVGVPPFNANELGGLIRMMRDDLPIRWDKRITGDCLNFLKGLLEKDYHKRLGWPKILDHPYVSNGLCVDREVGEFALTKALSPSQEFAKEIQRQDIQRKGHHHNGNHVTKKMLLKFHQLGLAQRNVMMPNGLGPRQLPLPEKQTVMDKNRKRGETKAEGKEGRDVNGNASDSSLDTLSSSSSEEDESEDEKATIVVNSRSTDSRGDLNSRSSRPPCDPWISGTRLALDRPTDDPVEIEEEWLDYLHKNMKEVIRNPETLCEKYSFRLIVQPLRNQFTGGVVVDKIAFLLSLPFSLGTKADPGMTRILESVYLESKVVANLIYASKLIVIRRRLEFGGSVESPHLPQILTENDLEAMGKCLRLVNFLVHSEDRFVVQFCDSILGFQAYVLFQLFLTLDGRRNRLTSDTLAILCNLMRILPANVSILEDIFFDYHKGEELWRLLAHTNVHIQSYALRLVGYLLVHSEKAREFLLATSPARLWRILRNAGTQSDMRIVAAAEFAANTLRQLGSSSATPSHIGIQQGSLPLKFSY